MAIPPYPMTNEELKKRIGQTLREIREERGLKLAHTANYRHKLGIKIDPSYLSRMETGMVEIPMRTLYPLVKNYGINLGEFFARCTGETLGEVESDQLTYYQKKRLRILSLRIQNLLVEYFSEKNSHTQTKDREEQSRQRTTRNEYMEIRRHGGMLIEIIRLTLSEIINLEVHETGQTGYEDKTGGISTSNKNNVSANGPYQKIEEQSARSEVYQG